MRLPFFSTDPLLRLLRAKKIATLPDLQRALGSQVPLTVFRKLKELGYRTSYSHRGRFYTLNRIASFDKQGLWSHDSVGFSRYRTLVDTAESFVNRSPSGYFVAELEDALHVSVQDPLLQLAGQQRISRQLVSGLYLYCSADPAVRQRQLQTRQAGLSAPSVSDSVIAAESVSDELKAGIILFYSLLDEKQRRLYAGLEALKLGRGGDRRISDLLGLDPHTVAKGRRELLRQEVLRKPVRQTGGGRKPTEKNARSDGGNRAPAGARHCGRPDDGPALDAQDHRQGCHTTEPARHSGKRTHRRPMAPKVTFFPAREPEEAWRPPPGSRPAVPIHRYTAPALPPTGQSDDQRGRQETGNGRPLQERRSQVGSGPHPRQRPRLSLAGQGHRRPVWHL